jgi:hypothetical protein
MIRIEFTQFARWCGEHGYKLEEWRPMLQSDDCHRYRYPLPSGAQGLTELADMIATLDDTSSQTVLWVRDWTIWNQRSQNVGLRHMSLLSVALTGLGSTHRDLIFVAGSDEAPDITALVLVPILYSWDAHLLFASGRAIIDISHDGYVELAVTREARGLAELLKSWFSG